MKLSRLIFASFFVFLICLIYASPYDIIPAGDSVLEDLRFLSLESGHSFLSFHSPLSPSEIKTFLHSIDYDLLTLPARDAYLRVQNRLAPAAPLSFTAENFSITAGINSTLEASLEFNNEISPYPEYPKIKPVLAVPLRFFFADVCQLYFEPAIIVDPQFYRSGGYFNSNIPARFDQIDMTVPLRGFAAAGGSWWSFQLGRDRLSYGTGITGNLAVSDNPAFYDFAMFSFISGYFKYSAMISQMPLAITAEIYDRPLDSGSLSKTMQRYLYLHRLDLNLFGKLSVGLMEGVMAGNSGIEIRYLNPFIVFHSLFSFWDYPEWDGGSNAPDGTGAMNGSLFSAEINWNIIRSLSVYGQFAMNQFATAYKLGLWPDQPPNGLGYLAGVNYSHSFSKWGSVFYLEFIYTDPYLFMNPSPFASLIHMRTLGYSPDRYEYSFIGYPRDAVTLALGAKFFNSGALIVEGRFLWLSRGEHGIKWDWEKSKDAYSENTPSGTAENKYIFGSGVQWKPLPFLVIDGSIALIFARGNNHVPGADLAGGQAAISLTFTY